MNPHLNSKCSKPRAKRIPADPQFVPASTLYTKHFPVSGRHRNRVCAQRKLCTECNVRGASKHTTASPCVSIYLGKL